MSEIEETFQRISQRPNVTGIIVVNNEGTPIRSTIEDTVVQNQYAHLISALAAKARHCIRDLDPTNDLSFLRIRSKKNEIMVAPDKDFILIVIQSVIEQGRLKVPVPSEESLRDSPYAISDFAIMPGKQRVEVLQEANIHPLLIPIFIRAIQHLTSLYAAGSIEDSYRLHRHVSAHVWGGSYNCPLLGYPQVNSAAFRDFSTSSPRRPESFGKASPAPGTIADSININGLVNQGATCYLNSLLQSLFHLSAFRSIIYNMPTKEEALLPSDETPVLFEKQEQNISIPYALQRLFCRLQTGRQAADTMELTASFGWSTSDGFVQHDVHELMHVLLNNLETKLTAQKSNSGDENNGNAINELFQGALENYVHVKEAGYYGSTEEPFYDLQLVVKNNKDIYTSFDAFFQIEVLDGKNSYCLERDGKRTYHRAEKGVRLKKIPPILLLHLTRFDYNMELGESKVFTKWAYYSTLDLSRYMPHLTSADTHYTLYSVLVHFGSNTGHGHYYCFLRCSGVWYKFNDEAVTPATLKEVFGSNFGGFTMNYWGSEVAHMNNAYMLVYIRTSELPTLLRPVCEEDLPQHVVDRLRFEENERLRIERELAEDHLYGRIQFVLPQEVVENNELYYGKSPSNLKLPSHRVGRFHLEADLLEACVDFVQQKKLCTEEERPTLMLWYATRTSFSSGRTASTCQTESASPGSSENGETVRVIGGEGLLRLSGKIEPGMKVRDIVRGGQSCFVMLTSACTVSIVDLSSGDGVVEQGPGSNEDTVVFSDVDQAGKCSPEYQIFHHSLYDPLHLRVLHLGSTIVYRNPSAPMLPTLKCLEKIMLDLISRLNLDEDDKLLLNHDINYDKECRRLEGKTTSRGEESSISPTVNFSQARVFPKSSSSMLLTASRASLTPSVSQADDLDGFFADFIDGPPSSGQSGVVVSPTGSPTSSGLSVHVEDDNNAYTLLYHWEEDVKPSESATVDNTEEPGSGSSKISIPPSPLNTTVSSSRKQWRKREKLYSGDILVWQAPVDPKNPNIFYPDIVAFQQFLQSQVTFTIRLNRPPVCPPLVKTTLSESMTYEQLQRYVARLIGEKDYDRIRFTRHNPETEQPYFMKGMKADLQTLRQLLSFSVYRVTNPSAYLYYERCKYPVSRVEKAHSLQFQLFNDSVKHVSSHWILLPLDVQITKTNFFKAVVEEIVRDFKGHKQGLEEGNKNLSKNNNDSTTKPSILDELFETPGQAKEIIASTPTPPPTTAEPTVEGEEVDTALGCSFSQSTIFSPTVTTNTRMPILDFILHHCRPEDAWQHFRLVDCWRGRIYSVFDADHPLFFSSRNTFEESALYRIEYLPLPLPVSDGADRSPSVLPLSGASTSDLTTDPTAVLRRKYPNQTLINVYHFSQVRGKRDGSVVETHSDPFSLYISHEEYMSQLLSRIAIKLGVPMLTLQDWRLCFVKEKRIVPVEEETPILRQWAAFCESCSVSNGGGGPVSVDVCDVSTREPLKVPFLGLEHAKPNKVRGSKREEKVVIRN